MKRAAFTLIELLVVIAIIAILAAILFPVFAQAKLAAKKTQSLSNQKQNNLSVAMYSTDSDDMAVLTFWPGCGLTSNAPGATYPGPLDTDPVRTCAANAQIPGWPRLIQPYSKSWDLLRDPVVGDPNSIYSPGTSTYWWVNWGRFANYGYNWAYICPSTTAQYSAQRPYSTTSFGDPANTVQFVDSRNFVTTPAPGKWVSGYMVTDPPTALNTGADEYWFGGWNFLSPDPRYNNGFNVAWADGHVKFDRLSHLSNDSLWDRL